MKLFIYSPRRIAVNIAKLPRLKHRDKNSGAVRARVLVSQKGTAQHARRGRFDPVGRRRGLKSIFA